MALNPIDSGFQEAQRGSIARILRQGKNATSRGGLHLGWQVKSPRTFPQGYLASQPGGSSLFTPICFDQ
jgi:hypothetical protein